MMSVLKETNCLTAPILIASAILSGGFSASLWADGGEQRSAGEDEQRLVPVMETHLRLIVCATTNEEYGDNSTVAREFHKQASSVSEAVVKKGWSQRDIASATVAAMEQIAGLEPEQGDTRETFYLRHFSEDFCNEQVSHSQTLIAEGKIPSPR